MFSLLPGEIIVDNFAGGGGASLGIEMALGCSPHIAINHDREAIALHQANHPKTAVGGMPVGLAWFSPDCKHFSKAKGGKPVSKKIRSLAWVVVRWAKAVRPRVIILENVEEFADWGPLVGDKPDPDRKGFTFRRWKAGLERLGYRVEHRELIACDYGAPTSRKRLFVVARCDGQPIVWPKPTHGEGLQPYRTAAECIDWSLPAYSIFLTKEEAKQYGIKRPLAAATMARIARGLKRFVLDNPRPFIVGLAHGEHKRGAGSRSHDLNEPIRTIHAGGNNFAVVAPVITEHANATNPRSWTANEPLRTQCAEVKGGHFALVAPYMVPRYGERAGQEPRSLSVEAPMPTIVPTQNGGQLVAAFMAKHYGGHETPGSALVDPVNTITTQDHNALVTSNLVKMRGTNTGQRTDDPLQTLAAQGTHFAEVRAFMVAYYGNEKDGGQMADPMRTVTSRERFGLVTVHGQDYAIVDIGMRMLAPRELYRAQGFPDSYQIEIRIDGKPITKEAQVRMVGNSVCPPIAAAMVRAQFVQALRQAA